MKIEFAKYTMLSNLSMLFIHSSDAANIVKDFFSIVSIGYLMYMLTSCFLAILSGLSKPGMSTVHFFIYYIIIRIPLVALLVNTSLMLNEIWVAILVSHILAAVLASIICFIVIKKQNNDMMAHVLV